MANKFEGEEECEIQLNLGKFSKIQLCRIPSDGNCIFGAIVHQLFLLDVGSEEYAQRVIHLRKEVVTHLKANLARFERELSGRIYEKRHGKSKVQNFEEDSRKFLDNYLAKERHWGGAETTAAVAELFKANIIIMDECDQVRCGNIFDESYDDIITIAFRLPKQIGQNKNTSNLIRNHYDSVVKLNDDIIKECATNLISTFKKNCSIKNTSDSIFVD